MDCGTRRELTRFKEVAAEMECWTKHGGDAVDKKDTKDFLGAGSLEASQSPEGKPPTFSFFSPSSTGANYQVDNT